MSLHEETPRATPLVPDERAAATQAPSEWTICALIALLCGIWGSTWFVIEDGLKAIPPLFGAGLRFAIAAAAMLLFAAPLARREGGAPPTLRLTLVVGTLNFALSYGIVYLVETVLPSGLVSVLWGTFPLGMALAGHVWIPAERLDVRQAVGFGVGFLGVFVLFLTDLRSMGGASLGMGILLLGSPLVSIVGQTILKREGAGTSSVLLNRNAMILGAALLLLASLVFEGGKPTLWTPRLVLGLLYLSLVGTVLTFGLYFWLLRYAPANSLSLIAYVTPVVALWLGVQFGTDELQRTTLIGTGLVLGGIVLVRRRRRRALSPP